MDIFRVSRGPLRSPVALSNPETVVPVSNLYAITVGDSAEMNWYESTDEQYQSLTWNLYRTTTSGCARLPQILL